MSEWKQVTKCPYCGGRLIAHEFHSLSHDYKVTTKGRLSKRYTLSNRGSIGAWNVSCSKCETVWEDDEIVIDGDIVALYMEDEE